MPYCDYLSSYSFRLEPQGHAPGESKNPLFPVLTRLLRNCGVLEDASYKPTAYDISLQSTGDDSEIFVDIFKKSFPDTEITNSSEMPSVATVTLSGGLPKVGDVKLLLEALNRHITIRDTLDESHALSPHHVPVVSDNGRLKRTRLGDLVYRAKDYNRRKPVGNQGAANALVRALKAFIRQHPRYRAADVIVCAPSSQRTVTSNLPSYIGPRLGTSLGMRFERAERVVSAFPQKERKDLPNPGAALNIQLNTMAVTVQLGGSSCILLDDLYESGGTLRELGRACRQAGAEEVLGLTVTKTAGNTQGMDTAEWPWR